MRDLKPPDSDCEDLQAWETYLDEWESTKTQYQDTEYATVRAQAMVNEKMQALFEILLRILVLRHTGNVFPLDNPNTWTLATFKTWYFRNDTWYTKREDPDEPSMDYLDMYDLDGFSIETHDIKRGARYEVEGSRDGDVIQSSYKLDPEIEGEKWKAYISDYHPLESRAFSNLERRCSLTEWERDGSGTVYNPAWVRRGQTEFFLDQLKSRKRHRLWKDYRKQVNEAA